MRSSQVLRAPTTHRVVAAVACPVLAYFVARLLLRFTSLPSGVTYAVCLLVGLFVGYRAWSARVELRSNLARVHNTLATTTIAHENVRRVNQRGRIESRGSGSPRSTHLPAEALHEPWWAFGTGQATYAVNRERMRSWHRLGGLAADRDGGSEPETGSAA